MIRLQLIGGILSGIAFGLSGVRVSAAPAAPNSDEFFEKKIRPVLVASCYKCHSNQSDKVKGNLVVDSLKGLANGGDSGPAIVAGKPQDSLLIKAISYTEKDMEMPPKNRLASDVVADFSAWVAAGAHWPGAAAADKPAVAGGGATGGDAPVAGQAAKYEKLRKELWSWQPIRLVRPPEVMTASAVSGAPVSGDIDRFVVSKLEANHLHPSPTADKPTLLRRATFDLTGLPPTPAEMELFLSDTSPDAFAHVVDRLLGSPRFGERWGRHWLDVARYAESTGMTRNYLYYYAWRYRDYVIRAFNQDRPFDRFVTEQLAGDLLPFKTPQEHDQNQIATGFLAVGPADYNEKNHALFVMNIVDEQIDATSKAFFATTVGCARCHDHKFDAIPTADYYAMAGIFKSSVDLPGLNGKKKKLDVYEKEHLIKLSGFTASEAADVEVPQEPGKATPGQKLKRLAKIKNAAQNPSTATAEHFAMGVREGTPTDTNILPRGELDKAQNVVPRGFLHLPSMTDYPAIPSNQSGRLQLAQWITSRQNPLTSRVEVNRIWQHLFGQGIVKTVDNFGIMGDKPTHPELLDYLASDFMTNGWSVKKTIRQIMLSKTYQQSSTFDRAMFATDPDNKLLWRMNQRRLEAEAVRDAILASSGKLNTVPPTGSVALTLPPIQIGKKMDNLSELSTNATYRSVYLPIFRESIPEVLEVFDMAEPDAVTGARDVTTVAPQALFMLNSGFVQGQAKAMVERVANSGATSDASRIDMAYRLALGRPASSLERDRGVTYLSFAMRDSRTREKDAKLAQTQAWADFFQALFACAEFRYVN